MGKIFPMASLVVRLGLVRKREKEARRAAIAQSQLTVPATALRPEPVDTRPLLEAPSKPVLTGLQRFNARRAREAKHRDVVRRTTQISPSWPGASGVTASPRITLKEQRHVLD